MDLQLYVPCHTSYLYLTTSLLLEDTREIRLISLINRSGAGFPPIGTSFASLPSTVSFGSHSWVP